MNVQPVDLGDEVRQRVEPRLAPAPVVVRRPVLRQLLHRRKLDALRLILRLLPLHRLDGLLLGPARGLDARTQRLELRLGELDLRERPDRCGGRWLFGRDRHGVSVLLGVVTPLGLLLSSARRARRRPWSAKSTTAELTFTQLG